MKKRNYTSAVLRIVIRETNSDLRPCTRCTSSISRDTEPWIRIWPISHSAALIFTGGADHLPPPASGPAALLIAMNKQTGTMYIQYLAKKDLTEIFTSQNPFFVLFCRFLKSQSRSTDPNECGSDRIRTQITALF